MSELMCKLGDTTSHGGSINTNPSGDINIRVETIEALADGCSFICPIHGLASFAASGKANIKGSKSLRNGDAASCSATAMSSATKTRSE